MNSFFDACEHELRGNVRKEEAFALSDRVMVMGEGSIHQLAAPDEIIANPADDYVADFVVKNLRIKMDSLARFMDR